MSKKTIVTSVLLSNVPNFAASFFRVGDLPLNIEGNVCMLPGINGNEAQPAFPPVSKIEFSRDRFGGGAQIDQPAYLVHFENAPERVVIRANAFCQVTVAVVEPEENNIPGLPE